MILAKTLARKCSSPFLGWFFEVVESVVGTRTPLTNASSNTCSALTDIESPVGYLSGGGEVADRDEGG